MKTKYLVHDPKQRELSSKDGYYIRHYIKLVDNQPVTMYIPISDEDIHSVVDIKQVNNWVPITDFSRSSYEDVKKHKGYRRISRANVLLELL